MSPQPPVESLTILVVDDERLLVRTLKRALEHLGHTVFATEDPDQAVELARAHKPDVALIDLDLGEGKENGHSICARIRKAEPTIVIFMWSGAPPEDICYESLRAGAVEHLVKPVSVEVLLAKFWARVKLQRESVPPPPPPPDFPLQIDRKERVVTLDGHRLDVARNERRLLELLLLELDRVLSLQQIEARLGLASEGAAKVLLHTTRKKLEPNDSLIENVRSEGFVMRSAWRPKKEK